MMQLFYTWKKHPSFHLARRNHLELVWSRTLKNPNVEVVDDGKTAKTVNKSYGAKMVIINDTKIEHGIVEVSFRVFFIVLSLLFFYVEGNFKDK
jgi:hypothetical protein